MGYKHAHWRWSNVLLSLVLLMMPVIMCAMEQEEEMIIDGMNLIEASCYGNKEVVDSLIKAGADINAADKNSYTALIWASVKGHKEVVENLIKGGANPYIKNKKGKNTFDIAQDENRQELRKHIIKERSEYVIKKYKEYLIDGKNHMENLAASLQKECDWYKSYSDEDSKHDEHHLQEVKQYYPFHKDIAKVIAKFTHGISDDEWAQMLRLESEQQSLK